MLAQGCCDRPKIPTNIAHIDLSEKSYTRFDVVDFGAVDMGAFDLLKPRMEGIAKWR